MPLRYPFAVLLRLSCLACVLASSSCLKLLQVPPAATQLQTPTVFSGDQQAATAMAGLYSQLMTHPRWLFNGGISLYPGLGGDELHLSGKPLDTHEDAFAADTLHSDNSLCSGLYGAAFTYINMANAILQGLSGSASVSAGMKNRLQGEAEFIRALTYFYLVNLFGDVPLVTGTDYTVNAAIPRIPVAIVYAKIVADLRDAQTLLSEQYTGSETLPGDRIYPNKAAATALLARVYLYLGDWADAETQAGAVIADEGLYGLEPELDKVFLSTSREAIWQLQPVSKYLNTAEGNIFIPAASPTAAPVYVLNYPLFQAFDSGDLRRIHWIGTKTVLGTVYAYPFKYKVSSGGLPYTEYNMVLRLAEQYLIRAEARVRQGNISNAAADLNKIRGRAGLGPTPAMDPDSLLSAIYRERQTEFFAEWGHRWLDLKRTGQLNTTLGAVKPYWKASDTLYPIPFSELQLNPQLTQNPGY